MNAAERRMEMFRILNEELQVEVADLAERLGVSGMTIRRDLAAFEKQGVVTTTYGGAYLNKDMNAEPSFSLKSNQMIEAKQRIARKAASFVQDGDNIVLDCGTTVLQMAKYLQDKKITVITNSWPLISYLGSNAKINLILLPGKYDEISAGAFGESTIRFLHDIHADKAFIGTHGWNIEAGATVPTFPDAEVKMALLNSARQKFLLTDSTKYNQVHLAAHAKTEDFDFLISDDITQDNKKLEKIASQLLIV